MDLAANRAIFNGGCDIPLLNVQGFIAHKGHCHAAGGLAGLYCWCYRCVDGLTSGYGQQ